jgi:hemerythrin-like domain-containing protein
MPATDSLKEEHRVIERMLHILNVAAERLDKGEDVAPRVFETAGDFIRTFADRGHHGKEEDCLFPLLEQRGIPRQGGPIEVMLAEHEEGRRFVRGMLEALERYKAGDREARSALAQHARGYTSLLSDHIPKEDNILYPMGEMHLTSADQTRLQEMFQQVEKERMGEGKHQEYVHLIEELEKQLQIK